MTDSASDEEISQHNNVHRFGSMHVEGARDGYGYRKSNDPSATVSFDRKELNLILRVYGFRVASGEWRDYAIDMLKGRAVFSVFRRTSEVPLYMIEKNPKLARRQGAYSVINASGHILKRGHDLTQVLRVFDKKPRLAAV